MDYRRPLFQLEQWSPFLAKRLWNLKALIGSPFILSIGLKVHHLTDLNADVEVPNNLFNRGEKGQIRPLLLTVAGEFAGKILWQRHLNPDLEEIVLSSVHCKFLRPAITSVRARTELLEVERERILRKLRTGDSADFEMPVVITDNKDQQVAQMNCIWHLKPLRPATLGAGR